jgi:hypothetical protein
MSRKIDAASKGAAVMSCERPFRQLAGGPALANELVGPLLRDPASPASETPFDRRLISTRVARRLFDTAEYMMDWSTPWLGIGTHSNGILLRQRTATAFSFPSGLPSAR